MDLQAINNERLTTDGIRNATEDILRNPISTDYENYEYYYGNQTEDLGDIDCDARTLRIYSFIILVPGVLGIIGNLVSAMIINRQPEGSASVMALLLKILAIVDNSYVLLYLITIHLTYTFYYSYAIDPTSIVVQIFTIVAEPILFFVQMSTVYVTIIIAFMRYIAICKPFKAPTVCTRKNAWLALLVTAVISVVIHLPMFFAHTLIKEGGIWYATPTKLYEYKSYNFGYRIVFMDILMRGVVPLAALMFFNGRLLMSLYRQPKVPCISDSSEPQSSMTQQKEAQNVTVVIMAIIGVFILSYLPQTVNYIIQEMNPQRFKMSCGSPEYNVNYVFDALMALNSCVNFVIYYLLRENFRKRLKVCLFGCCFKETAL